jgi:hypothetical protein
MTDRPTPETDAVITAAEEEGSWEDTAVALARLSQRLERQRDALLGMLSQIDRWLANNGLCPKQHPRSGIVAVLEQIDKDDGREAT